MVTKVGVNRAGEAIAIGTEATARDQRQTRIGARLLLATRPAFLSITVLAVLLGFAHAATTHALPSLPLAGLALLGALLAHAGANVLNDVHDANNGSDACNTDRIAPFTGGSRFIQNGTLDVESMQRLAFALLAMSMLSGLGVLALTDARLLGFGLAGLLLAIAYSAPPLQLMARGFGEIAVGAAWLLVVAGSDFVARRQLDSGILWVALPFALQVMLILLVNQVPDFAADAAVGKRNWVVRWGRARAALFYLGLLAACFVLLAMGIALRQLPLAALLCFTLLPVELLATRDIFRFHAEPQRLRRAVVLTLISAHLVGLGLLLSLTSTTLMKSSP